MNWYFNLAGSFLHGVFAQPYQNGVRDTFSSTYDVATVIVGIFLFIGLVAWGVVMDGFWGAVRRVPLMVAWLLWPYVLIVAAPLIALVIPALLVYSYVRLLPDKETRIQRTQDKVHDLAGRINERSY